MSLLIIMQSLHVTQVEAVTLIQRPLEAAGLLQQVCCSGCPREWSPKMEVALGEGCLIPIAWPGDGAGLLT